MPQTPVQLDHVIVLLPYKDVVEPPAWIAKNFQVSPGGKHADGKTENRLILFQDGTYMELIAFIDDDPEKRRNHYWDKPFGIVDYALTTKDDLDYDGLQQRLKKSKSGISYAEPIAGGRTTPAGVELKWKVTFPEGVERGNVPFWCHDVTPRERRVPISKESTKHPSGAIGMACVVCEIEDDTLQRVAEAIPVITEHEHQAEMVYTVGTPVETSKKLGPAIRLKKLEPGSNEKLRLRLILDCGSEQAPPNLDQKVDGGEVLLGFV